MIRQIPDMNRIYNGCCIETMYSFRNECIDLCVTSPPYKDEDGYDANLICDFLIELYRIMKPGSLLFLNFGHLAGIKKRPFDVGMYAEGIGFTWIDTIAWIKNHYTPIQGSRRFNNLWEPIFMFCKGKMPAIDRLAIGVPYKDKLTAKRYGKGKDLRCGGNVWHISYETLNAHNKKIHPDRFPIELPIRCMKLIPKTKERLTVLDPFSGSGTSAVAAVRHGWNYIGIEKDQEHYQNSLIRLKEVVDV